MCALCLNTDIQYSGRYIYGVQGSHYSVRLKKGAKGGDTSTVLPCKLYHACDPPLFYSAVGSISDPSD